MSGPDARSLNMEASGPNLLDLRGCLKNMKPKSCHKKHTRCEEYKEDLLDKTFSHGMDVLRSEGHHFYVQHLNKVSLSPFDLNRWNAQNGVDILAYGDNAR